MAIDIGDIASITREMGALQQSDITTKEMVRSINEQLQLISSSIHKIQISNAEFSQSFKNLESRFSHVEDGLKHANEDIIYIKDQIKDIQHISSNSDEILRTVNEWNEFKDNELKEIKSTVQKNTTKLATWTGGMAVAILVFNQFIAPNLNKLFGE